MGPYELYNASALQHPYPESSVLKTALISLVITIVAIKVAARLPG